MKKKYVLRPGRIHGQDGQTHNIGADDLVGLYRVNHSECVILHNDDPYFDKEFCIYVASGYIFLHPRSDENYSWLQNRLENY